MPITARLRQTNGVALVALGTIVALQWIAQEHYLNVSELEAAASGLSFPI